jgi:hypothetical protein
MRFSFLVSLTGILSTLAWSVAADPLEVTWRVAGRRPLTDILRINGSNVVIPRNTPLEKVEATLKRVGLVSVTQPIRVTIPVAPEHLRFTMPGNAEAGSLDRMPEFQGWASTILDQLTRPDREVTYFYKGRELRRYRIICSSKGTADSPELAKYSLDGEALGTWDAAKERLLKVENWEQYSVVDILFDRSNFLTSSGVGLYLLPELDRVFRSRGMRINKHMDVRPLNDD